MMASFKLWSQLDVRLIGSCILYNFWVAVEVVEDWCMKGKKYVLRTSIRQNFEVADRTQAGRTSLFDKCNRFYILPTGIVSATSKFCTMDVCGTCVSAFHTSFLWFLYGIELQRLPLLHPKVAEDAQSENGVSGCNQSLSSQFWFKRETCEKYQVMLAIHNGRCGLLVAIPRWQTSHNVG